METALSTTNNLALDPQILSQLTSYDEYLDFYIQLDQTASAYSWLKADLLLNMSKKLGEQSLDVLAKDIKQPLSTVTNYIRTALAFPPEKRDQGASFSIHFQASFADSLKDSTKGFDGEKRFEWVEKAIDNNLSTRKLASEIQVEKTKAILKRDDAFVTRAEEAEKMLTQIHDTLHEAMRLVKRGDKYSYKTIKKVYECLYGNQENGDDEPDDPEILAVIE